MSATTSGSLIPVVVAPSVPQSMRMCFSSPPGLNVSRKQSPRPWRYMRTLTLGRLTTAAGVGCGTAGFLLRDFVTRADGRRRLTRRTVAFFFLAALRGTVGMVDLAHHPRCSSANGSRSGLSGFVFTYVDRALVIWAMQNPCCCASRFLLFRFLRMQYFTTRRRRSATRLDPPSKIMDGPLGSVASAGTVLACSTVISSCGTTPPSGLERN